MIKRICGGIGSNRRPLSKRCLLSGSGVRTDIRTPLPEKEKSLNSGCRPHTASSEGSVQELSRLLVRAQRWELNTIPDTLFDVADVSGT